jgi:hypothetical protein
MKVVKRRKKVAEADDALDLGAARSAISAEVDLLSELIHELFPAEAASNEISDPRSVMRLTKDLLERLWRWEH